jgi:hypothetical protein
MFKTGGFAEELELSMKKELISNQLESKFGFSKLSKAADFLNLSAEIFERFGMYKEAEEVLKIVVEMASK